MYCSAVKIGSWLMLRGRWSPTICAKKKFVGDHLPRNICQEPVITPPRYIHYATTKDQTENQHCQTGIFSFRHHTPLPRSQHPNFIPFIKNKGKALPLQAWSGPEDSRFPDFMTTAQDGGKVVSLTYRPPLPPGNTLLLEVESTPGS